jgi:hypothetical protein
VSFEAIKLVQYTDGLTLAQYGVLVSIASYAEGKDWRCRRSLSQLATSSHLHRATAVRAVRRLLASYTEFDPRPLMYVFNDRSDHTNVNAYVLNKELLRDLRKQSRKTRAKTLCIQSAPDMQDTENSNLSHWGEGLVGVVPTPTKGMTKCDIETLKQARIPTAASEAKKFAREILRTMAQLTDEALSRLADQIAVRHPLSRLRDLTLNDVVDCERTAILKAMGEEAISGRMNMAEAGRGMLSRLDEWDGIPCSEWRLLVDIPNFYANRYHCQEPGELIRALKKAKNEEEETQDSVVQTRLQTFSIFPRMKDVATSSQHLLDRRLRKARSQFGNDKNQFR